MKKLSIVLYVILFLAIGSLYILHFTGNKKSVVSESSPNVTSQGIAYVNIDSIIINFDMFSDRREELMSKQQSAEAELTSKGTQYEKGARDYQEKVTKGLVTRATAAQMEQALLQQQQELMSLRDQLQADLMEEEQVMNRQILEYITDFLEENREKFNFQYVLGRSFGGIILYSDSALDITDTVLEAINQKYQGEKK